MTTTPRPMRLDYDQYDALLQRGWRSFFPEPPDDDEAAYGQWGAGVYVLDDGSTVTVLRAAEASKARAVYVASPSSGGAMAELLTSALEGADRQVAEAVRSLRNAREAAVTVATRSYDVEQAEGAALLHARIQKALDALASRV